MGVGALEDLQDKRLKRKTASSNKWSFFGYRFNKATVNRHFSNTHGNLNMN